MAGEITTIQSISGKEIAVYDANYDNSQMDQEGFLEVLLTSFQYQDPFETQDISKFIDNTVKLHELEIMNAFEESVEGLNNNNTLFLTATNLIGKEVLYQGEKSYVEGGETHIEFQLPKEADVATLYLYDSEGRVVAERSFTDLVPNQRYTFDLEDETVADGYYRVSVVAKKETTPVEATIYSTARVDGIEKDGADIVALIDDAKVPVSEIMKIGG
ncbi:MAG: flagellar hook capping protein [Epsilonproteobacteria bacterium]|nr:flagellar hook capping protein [Campylobacterota bacterium]NPA56894.1 flagellar hook capping protein [Campylobacterota bacterium]